MAAYRTKQARIDELEKGVASLQEANVSIIRYIESMAGLVRSMDDSLSDFLDAAYHAMNSETH